MGDWSYISCHPCNNWDLPWIYHAIFHVNKWDFISYFMSSMIIFIMDLSEYDPHQQCEAPVRKLSWCTNHSNFTMVYGTQITIVIYWGESKPTDTWGGAHWMIWNMIPIIPWKTIEDRTATKHWRQQVFKVRKWTGNEWRHGHWKAEFWALCCSKECRKIGKAFCFSMMISYD